MRIGTLPSSGLIARKLGRIELWPRAAPAYLPRHGSPTTPDALAGHALLGWEDRPGRWLFTDRSGRHHPVAIPAGTVIREPAVLQVLLAGGVGIGRVPNFLARPLVEAGTFVRLLPDHVAETVEAHAVYQAHRSLPAKVRVFVDAIAAHLGELRRERGGRPPDAGA